MTAPEQVRAVALQFSREIRERIGDARMREVIARNKRYSEHACATHDFCDANIYMLAAMSEVLQMPEDDIVEACWNDTLELTALWNAAWTMAKASKFEVQ